MLDRLARSLSRVAAVVGLLVGLVLLAGPLSPVAAEPPGVVDGQIDDTAGVLSPSDLASVKTAIAQLNSDKNLQLFVVYVKTFNSIAAKDWATQTGTASSIGGNNILLAVAVQDRAYGYYRPTTFPLTDAQVNQVMVEKFQPALSKNDWAGAAVAAAQGLADPGGSSGGSATPWIVGGVVVVGAGGYLVYRGRKKTAAATAGGNGTGFGPEDLGPDGQPIGTPAEPAEPLEALNDRAVNLLIQTDNAVRASQNELATAQTEFGVPATSEFRTEVEQAMTELTEAFRIRQELDDDIPEDEPTKRKMLADILEHCNQASDGLDAQTDRFINLRDLKGRLPLVIAGLPAAIATARARIPVSTATLQRLATSYAPHALVAVSGNLVEADQRLDFATEQQTTAAQQAAAAGIAVSVDPAPVTVTTVGTPATAPDTGASDSTAAVLTTAEAQGAVQQAGTLLDAIDRMDGELTKAAAQLGTARDHVTAELADARSAFAAGNAGSAGSDLSVRLQRVQTVLDSTAGPAGAMDPINALTQVSQADTDLDDILAETRSAQQQVTRVTSALQNAMTAAQSGISTAADFIDTRRGGIGSQARTRLAEAQRHFAQAQSMRATDINQALTEAHQAVTLSQSALQLAQSDVDDYQRNSGGGLGGGGRRSGLGGAILGGILMNAVLNSGRRGGGWGGGGGGWGGGGGGGFGGGGGGTSGGGRF